MKKTHRKNNERTFFGKNTFPGKNKSIGFRKPQEERVAVHKSYFKYSAS
jgi:hypothetical protein